MRPRALAAGLWLSLAVSFCAFAPGGPLPASAQTGSHAAFSSDKGKFRIVQDGSEAGTETFELAPSGSGWIARGETTIRAGKNDAHSAGQLRLNPDGTPVRYEWSSQSPKKASGAVDFSGTLAKTSITIDGKDPYHQDFTFTSPRVAVLDNNLYDQYAVLAILYNWSARGKQTFPVLIPQDLTPGTIDVESLGSEANKDHSTEVLRASTPDLEILLYFDARHHLMRLEVPAAKVVIERQ